MTQQASALAAPTGAAAYYVYGIVPADAPVGLVVDAGMGEHVELHALGGVAALVEPVDTERAFGRRRDLVAHSAVLNTMAAHVPVLPMRFGSVVEGREALDAELLGPQREHFEALLAQVAGRVQYTLRARYVLDTVLAEVVAAEPEIAELRRRTVGRPEDATHFERIRLGELVSTAVEQRRRAEEQQLVERISAVSQECVARGVSEMDAVADLALMVGLEDQAELERVSELLAVELDGRVRLSLVGPMALFDFVTEL